MYCTLLLHECRHTYIHLCVNYGKSKVVHRRVEAPIFKDLPEGEGRLLVVGVGQDEAARPEDLPAADDHHRVAHVRVALRAEGDGGQVGQVLLQLLAGLDQEEGQADQQGEGLERQPQPIHHSAVENSLSLFLRGTI